MHWNEDIFSLICAINHRECSVFLAGLFFGRRLQLLSELDSTDGVGGAWALMLKQTRVFNREFSPFLQFA